MSAPATATPFDHAALVGADARLADRAAEQADLRRAVRRAQAGAAAIVVGGAPANFGKNMPPIAQARRLPLQHKDRRALRPDGPAGLCAEGAAVAVVGQGVLFGELDEES